MPIADLEVDEDTVGHITFFKNKKLAYFRESDNTWKIGPNICDSIIYCLVSNEIQHDYIDRFQGWKHKNMDETVQRLTKKRKGKQEKTKRNCERNQKV